MAIVLSSTEQQGQLHAAKNASPVGEGTVEASAPVHVLSVLALLVEHGETHGSRLVVVHDFFTLYTCVGVM